MRASLCPGLGLGVWFRVVVRSSCKGFARSARDTRTPPGTSVRDVEPRLRGECECTYMCQDMCTSLCSAAFSSFACLLLIQFKFCPKRNVLAQVPSVHGRSRSACCFS